MITKDKKEGERMAKQQTKSERLETMYRQARMDLPRHMFVEWLCFCFGIFEAVTQVNQPINHGYISVIEKELKNLRARAGFLPKCNLEGCERAALDGLEFCSTHHSILGMIAIDREVEQEFKIEGKVENV